MKRPTVSHILIFLISHGVAALVVAEVVAVLRNSPVDAGDRLLALIIAYLLGGYVIYKEPENFFQFASEVEDLFRNFGKSHDRS